MVTPNSFDWNDTTVIFGSSEIIIKIEPLGDQHISVIDFSTISWVTSIRFALFVLQMIKVLSWPEVANTDNGYSFCCYLSLFRYCYFHKML